MKLEDLSPRARDLREMLLSAPRVQQQEACNIAGELANRVIELLNDYGIPVRTNLLAQALIARALTEIGAAWWSNDFGEHPIENTRAALLSIQIVPPDHIKGDVEDMRQIERGTGR